MQVEPGCDASHALTSACLWVDVFVQYRVHSKSLGDLRDAQNRCDPAPAVAQSMASYSPVDDAHLKVPTVTSFPPTVRWALPMVPRRSAAPRTRRCAG
jgi:hypothetical protein